MNLQALIETALVTKLSANANLVALVGTNIFVDQAPAQTPFPFVIFFPVAGGFDNDHLLSSANVDYQIEVYAMDVPTARTGAGYLNDALHMQTLNIASWTTYWMAQTKVFSRFENLEGNQYYSRGGIYNIRISQ